MRFDKSEKADTMGDFLNLKWQDNMNISLNWLTEYVDVTLPATELGELFTNIGLNCEEIDF